MEDKKVSLIVQMPRLEEVTKYINKHNKLLDVGVTQDEVLKFIVMNWSEGDYPPLSYKGIVVSPLIVLEEESELILGAMFSAVLSYEDSLKESDLEVYTLRDSPRDSIQTTGAPEDGKLH